MRTLIFIIVFFLVAALFIISENNLSLKDEQSRQELQVKYYSWLNKTFVNVKGLTGYVVKLDWLPKK